MLYTGHEEIVNSILWLQDDGRILSGSNDFTAQIWQASTGRHLLTYHQVAQVLHVSWDGAETIASCGTYNDVRLWEVNTGRTQQIITDLINPDATSWSPDGRYLAACGFRKALIWDRQEARVVQTYEGFPRALFSIAWSPPGDMLAMASEEGEVVLYQPLSLTPFDRYTEHNGAHSLSWNAQKPLLASAGFEGIVCIRDVRDRTTLQVIQREGFLAFSVAWSPDGAYLAIGGSTIDSTGKHIGGNVLIWRLADRQIIYTYAQHQMGVRAVAWAQASYTLASGGYDQTIHVWQPEL